MPTNLQTRRILGYDDLVATAPGTGDEALADVLTYDATIISQYNKYDMLPFTGDSILVRDTVARKLAAVNAALKARGFRLKVVYGYRHVSVQQAYFGRRRQEIQQAMPQLTGKALDKYTHNFVAVPEVAGHPVGGAVDVTIVDAAGRELDMGTAIADYTDPLAVQTFAGGLNTQQTAHRLLLHDVMVAEEFAPFYGEWWHFSYGDREWAAFYNKKMALYGAIDA